MPTLKQSFSLLLSYCLIYSQVLFNVAYAGDIQTDGSTQTTLDQARNGVAIVNIATPSAKGLSHNKFNKYSVDEKGVILNNSGETAVQTQLGGYIYGNKNLSAGSAKVILNEVTGSSRSRINGYSEVAGKKADLVLVNPNGISLNGAGFINIPNVTFSTGSVNVSNGAIQSFSVSRGDVTIEGQGLNTSTQTSTNIYAKYLQVNAKIHAQDLNVAVGSNRVDYESKQVTPLETTPTGTNSLLLDSSALGGMYANRITLVGTDKGVGVNLPPEVLASTGEITISNDGQIRLNQVSAKTGISVTSKSDTVTLANKTYGQNVRIDAAKDITVTQSGLAAAAQTIDLTAQGSLTNQGTVNAGVNANGTAATTGRLTVTASDISNQGTLTSQEQIHLQAGNTLQNQGTILAGATGQTGTITASATTIDNQQTLAAKNRVELNASQTITNSGTLVAGLNPDGTANTQGNLTVNSSPLKNSGTIATGTLATQNLTNQGSIIGQDLTAESLDNSTGTLTAQTITATGTITNTQGKLLSKSDLKLKAATLNNTEGSIASTQATRIEVASLANRQGQIASNRELTLNTATLDNTQGKIAANGTSAITATDLTNQDGTIEGSDRLTLQTTTLINQAGKITANGNLQLTATTLTNRQGTVASLDQITLQTETLDNTSGKLTANGAANLTATTLTNTGGTISSQDQLAIQTGTLENGTGTIAAHKASQITATTLKNQSGTIASNDQLTLQSDALDNTEGKITANTASHITTTTTLTNIRGTLESNGQLTVDSESLDNTGGRIAANNDLQLTSTSLVNQTGTIESNEDLTLQTETLDNSEGKVAADKTARITATTLTNTAGTLAGNETLTVQTTTLDNTQGTVTSGSLTAVTTSTLTNRLGTIHGNTDLTLNATNLNNNEGTLSANRSATIAAAATLTNQQGTITSNQTLNVTAGTLDNTNGKLASNTASQITATTLTNQAGTIAGNGNVTLATSHLDNSDGTVSAGNKLEIATQTITLTNSRLYAEEDLALKLNALNNIASSSIQSGGNLTIAARDSFTNNANLLANGNLNLSTNGAFTNYQIISAQGGLTITANSLTNSGGNARIAGGSGQSTLAIAGDITNNSRISSQDKLTVNASTLTNNGSLAAGNTLTTNTTNLYNHATLFSGGDMNLYTTGTLYNYQDANIFALNNMTLAANASGGKTGNITNDRATIETYNGDLTLRASYLGNITGDPTKTSSTSSSSTCTDASGQYCYERVDTTVVTEQIYNKPVPAKILSGHNLNIDSSSVYNKYSLIAANNNIQINTTSLTNASTTAYEFTTNIVKKYVLIQKSCPYTGIMCFEDHSWEGWWEFLTSTNTNTYTRHIDSVPSTIQAGGSVTVTGGAVKNGAVNEGTHFSGRTQQSGTTTTSTASGTSSAVAIAVTNLSTQIGTTSANTTIDPVTGAVNLTVPATGQVVVINLPKGEHGLFITNQNPAARYLVETNPEFTLYANFISSDYMMDHLEIDPAVTSKRVGDAFYENTLIRDSIFAQTGQRFLNKDLKNDYDQFKYLMDNALTSSKDLKLVAGISLSKEQVNSLTADIVWLEETIIQGQKVLVPVVYIANKNNFKLDNGAQIIAGENLELQVTSLVNSGTLQAGDSLSIAASDTITNNQGNLTSGGDMTLHATNDIRNTSGTIEGNNITIQSDSGSFVQETYTQAVSFGGPRGQVDDKTFIGNTAALTAQGNLSIQAGNNILIKGAEINAGNTSLTAQNVSFETIEDKQNYRKSGYARSSTTHIGSNLNTESLTITAKDKAKIEGSNVTAQGDLAITAGQIEILAVNDTTLTEKESSSKGLFSSKSSQSKDFTSTSKASTLSAGNIALKTTDRDLTITGSNVKAANELSLDAAHNISINAGYDGSFHESITKEGGLFSGGKLFSETEDLSGKMTKTAVASNLSGGNITLKAKQDIMVEGSNLSASQGLTGEAQNITIKAAENEEKTWSKHTETTVGAGDLMESITRPDKMAKVKDGKLTLKIADAEYEDATQSTKKTTVTSSNLAGGNIRLTADSQDAYQGNVVIEGSNLKAEDTIALNASSNVIIKEAKETTETKSASTQGKAELTANVKHQAVEVLKAAEALQQAQKALESANSAYDDYKDTLKQAEHHYKEGLIEKEDLDDVREDERMYQANLVLTTAALVAAVKNLTAQAIAAAASSGTYGFNADLQLDIDAVVEKARDISTRSVGSTLTASNITINAGNKALVQGSTLNAQNQIALQADEVEITAARDTSESASSKDHAHTTITYSVYGGPNVNASADSSESSSKSSTYANSHLNANNISITSAQDTTVTGAVVQAKDNLTLDVGGDLTVASLQDKSRSKSASIGASVGSSGGSSSVGANASLSKSNSKTVSEQTALLGNNVTITVANHTDLKGAQIAAADENGNDTGNLSLTTHTLSVENIKDQTRSDNMSVSAGTSGFESAGLGFSDSKQTNKATIGNGTLTINDQANSDLADLNRDLANSTVSIKDTGVQLNLDKATLDVITHPIATTESVIDDTQQIGILTKTAVKMVDAALEKDASLKEGADAVALGFNAVNNPAANARNKTDLAEKIANTETMTPEQLQEVTTLLFQEFQKQNLILDPATMKLVSTEGLTDAQIKQYHAATDVTTLQSFLNIQKTDITNGGSIYESVSAETIRQVYARAAKADPDATRNQALEEAVEQVAAGASKDTWNTFSNEQASTPETRTNWVMQNKDSNVVKAGNKELNQSNPDEVVPYLNRVEEKHLISAAAGCENGIGAACKERDQLLEQGDKNEEKIAAARKKCDNPDNCKELGKTIYELNTTSELEFVDKSQLEELKEDWNSYTGNDHLYPLLGDGSNLDQYNDPRINNAGRQVECQFKPCLLSGEKDKSFLDSIVKTGKAITNPIVDSSIAASSQKGEWINYATGQVENNTSDLIGIAILEQAALIMLSSQSGGMKTPTGKVGLDPAIIETEAEAKTLSRAAESADYVAKNAETSVVSSDGKKWLRTPSSIQDQMTLDAAKQGKGEMIIDNLGDPQFKGMEKWEFKVKSAEGRDSVVHYVRDPKTGELMDFKFKKQSTD